MFGGVGKSAGWATILVAGGFVLGASVSAKAADLGGDCCADLEERVAELEATTAKKGNRKVKLTVYGQVNEAVMFWDDGYEENAYIVTNDASRTRFGFKGGAKINDDWSANFKIEIGVRTASSKRTNQDDDEAADDSGFDVRHAWWNLSSKTYGTIQVGHTPTASEEATESNLAGTSSVGKYADVEDSGLGMRLRSTTDPSLSGVQWRRLIRHTGDQPGEGERRQAVWYISPEFSGFHASAAWGSDDSWDVGATYEGKLSGFEIEGRIAYAENTRDSDDSAFFGCIADDVQGPGDADCQQFGGSISVMHEASGLYGNFAAGWAKDNTVLLSPIFAGKGADDTSTFWAVEAGIQQKWFDAGKTTLFGQYYQMEGGANERQAVGAGDAINPVGFGAAHIFSSELDMWGLGVAQDLSKSMLLYALFRHYEADVVLTQNAGAGITESNPLEDLDILMTGAIIKF